MFEGFISKISELNSVSLKELDAVSLLDRVDSKYVLNGIKMTQIFPCLLENYKVLEINDIRFFSYENNYFDTPELQFYQDHHNGYAKRIKVRCRKYVESNLHFFEIKKKVNINRTNKHRETLKSMPSIISMEQKKIIQSFTRKKIKNIHLTLENNFNRITLVDNLFTERVTIDFNLSFKKDNEAITFDKIAIIEIKQSKASNSSPLSAFLRENNIREQSISKYIYGIILLTPSIKKNNFLPIIRQINNL